MQSGSLRRRDILRQVLMSCGRCYNAENVRDVKTHSEVYDYFTVTRPRNNVAAQVHGLDSCIVSRNIIFPARIFSCNNPPALPNESQAGEQQIAFLY